MTLKLIDLFAGVGGFPLGFEQRWVKTVLANEYDKSIANAIAAAILADMDQPNRPFIYPLKLF